MSGGQKILAQLLFCVICFFLNLPIAHGEIPPNSPSPNPADSSSEDFVYLPFTEASRGYTEREGKELKKLFDEYRVLDLKKSHLNHLDKWLTELNARLTKGAEKSGINYPNYRIYILASEEETAYVFKSQPPGHKVFRGHVFLSSGMVQKMISNLESGDIESASEKEFERLLAGIRGIMSHEFTHPKQDELVKWNWRAAQNGSQQNHGQLDELSTDIMAMGTSRDAALPPTDVLKGLELVFGDTPKQQSLAMRAYVAVKDDHPEEDLRLNLVRGALTKIRMDEGKNLGKPIEYDPQGLRSDLKRITFFHDLDKRLEHEVFKQPGSKFSNAVHALRDRLTKSHDEKNRLKKEVLAHLRLIHRAEEKTPNLTNEEINEFERLIDLMTGEGRYTLKDQENWFTYFQEGGVGTEPGTLSPAADEIRDYQRELRQIKAFSDSRFAKWLDHKIETDVFDIAVHKRSSFEALPRVLPKEWVEKSYRAGLTHLDRYSPSLQMNYLVHLWHGTLTVGAKPDIERDAINKIGDLLTTSPEARKEFLQSFPNVTGSRGFVARKFSSERFVRYLKTNPKESKELLESYANLFMKLFSEPEIARSINLNYVGPSIWKLINWQLDPQSFFLPFKAKYPVTTANTFAWFLNTLKSPYWKNEIDRLRAMEHSVNNVGGSKAWQIFRNVIADNETPFTNQQRLELIKVFLDPENHPLALDQSSYLQVLLKTLGDTTPLKKSAIEMVLSEMNKSSGLSYSQLLVDLKVENIFTGNRGAYFKFLHGLKQQGKLTELEYRQALETAAYEDGNINYKIAKLSEEGSYLLWKNAAAKGHSGSEFLRGMLEQFELARFNSVTFPLDNRQEKQEIEDAKEAGLGYYPPYAKLLSHIAGGLKSDFLKEFGFHRDFNPTDPTYISRFKDQFPKILEFYRLMFNPDNRFIPAHLKSLVNFKSLDDLASEFVTLIPTQGLSPTQEYEIWKTMAAKRPNRATDELFSRLIKNTPINEFPENELEFILEHGLLRSERYKLQLVKKLIEPEVELLAKNPGEIPDEVAYKLIIDKISRFAPSASRFRDELLEEIAWKMELDEKQLVKFVEPLKSFNFKALDLNSVNILSLVSVLLSKLSATEKIDFLKYIQHPRGSLMQTLPTLRNGVRELLTAFQKITGAEDPKEEEILELVEKLEGFIRDGGENERLILNEMLIGTRKHGLWFAPDSTVAEVYKLANLDAEDLKKFKAYSKALPKHERSVALSYLLAAAPDQDGSDSKWLRILELHNTPGIKFAQLASILSIFGEEESEKLAKAKDRSNPASRFEIYQRLREVYDVQQFANIKRLKAPLRSGGIKHVVIVEFHDGTTEAVYLRRRNIEDTIADTLEIVEGFVENLREYPEYADAYDYSHYINTLRQQLKTEVKFDRELELTQLMIKKYSKVRKHKGWGFEVVRPSVKHTQTGEVLHFAAIRGAKTFNELSPADQAIASELILNTEFDLLLNQGVFDADRHLGNYLFDPVAKRIYPIDFSQVYTLKPNGIFRAGDHYRLAKIFQGVSNPDPALGAKQLMEALVEVSENPSAVNQKTRKELENEFQKVLQTPASLNPDQLNKSAEALRKLLGVLARLNQARVHLPLKYTLGIFKGLSILMKEDYTKHVPNGFIENKIEHFATWQIGLGKRFGTFGKLGCAAWELLSNSAGAGHDHRL